MPVTEHRPVVVVGTPRSGTSMIAGLFAQLGCWYGTCRGPSHQNPKGFYENQILKRLILEHVGRGHTSRGDLAPVPERWNDIWAKAMVEDGYAGGPWVVKHSAVYWKLWEDWDPIFVVCWRDRASIIESWGATYGGTARSVDRHYDVMRRIKGHHVSTPGVVIGKGYQPLIDACEESGIAWNNDIVREWIAPDHWHHLPSWAVIDARPGSPADGADLRA